MKVKKYIKQSYRYMLLLVMLTITTNLYAQFVDATRALEWKLYGDAVSKKMAEQEALQLTISGNHIYMHAQNGKIVDIQDEMNKYLSKFHDKLKLAAMCYSLYYECKTVVENVQSINKSISENPEGIICTAVVDQRGMIYLRLFSHTLSLINDVYQIFSNKKDEGDEDEARNKMTEKERIEQLDIVVQQGVHLLRVVELLGDRLPHRFQYLIAKESLWAKPLVDFHDLVQVLIMQELVDDIDTPDILAEREDGLDIGLRRDIAVSVLVATNANV